MRALACVIGVVVGGCSFERVPAETGGGTGVDATGAGSGMPSDAPTTSAACLARATTTFAGHHYFATASSLAWTTAQQDCASVGAHLVKIETSAENDFVTTTFAAMGGYTWIGLHDGGGGSYVWADGSALGTYTAWTHVPSPGNCVDSNGTWDGYGCTNNNHGGACECE